MTKKFFILPLIFGFIFPSMLIAGPDRFTNSMPDSKNKIIKLTDQGIVPETLRMRVEDSIVFLLNQTSDALTTIEIDYKEKSTHCASTNLKIEEAGKIRSVKPFGPKDFASACFHDKGTYPITVYGLAKNPGGVKASIVVE